MNALVRQHLSSAVGGQDGTVGGGGGGVRGRIAVEFYEKKRRRSGLWFGGLAGKAEEEVCWEMWTLDVTIATPRTESGMYLDVIYCSRECLQVLPRRGRAYIPIYIDRYSDMLLTERAKVRKAMGNMLQKAALKILTVVNRDKDHIPPITTSDSNPFPYRIVVNPRTDSWGNRVGLY